MAQGSTIDATGGALDLSRLGLTGSTTAVPGAAGGPGVAGAASGLSSGVVDITIPLGDAANSFASQMEGLFGRKALNNVWGNDPATTADPNSTDSGSQGNMATPGPASIGGLFSQDFLAWIEAHIWELIIAAIVVILILVGIRAATSK